MNDKIFNSKSVRQKIEYIHKLIYNSKARCCSTNTKILSIILKHNGVKSKCLRYYVKGEENKRADEINNKLIVLNGEIYKTHVVLELGSEIIDCHYKKIVNKNDYECLLKSKNSKDVIGILYLDPDKSKIEDLKIYLNRFNLESVIFYL